MPSRPAVGLTKKLYLAHSRCPKLAWWQAHEPAAPELAANPADRVRIKQGQEVDALARSYIPEQSRGYTIERWGRSPEMLYTETDNALRRGAPVIYQGAFASHGALVFGDILMREDAGWTLIEVKAVTSVTDDHIAEVAFQTAIVRATGVEVAQAEIMHLNRECRYPDLSDLFVRENVTEQANELAQSVPQALVELDRALKGDLPTTPIGDQCSAPDDCPFKARCWPSLPDHHVSTLYKVQKKKVKEYVAAGYHTIHDLPDDLKLSAIAARQRRSVREGSMVVERNALIAGLARLEHPVAHLDFETVQLAIPRWDGCRPYDHIPVQMSCHVVTADGSVAHHAWLADGPGDPRRAVAEAVLSACRGARTVTAYFASFEQGRLREMADACPDLADELRTIADGIVDLLPLIRETVYHPEFGGSFSLKKVLPALVPTLSYTDLAIRDGGTASAELLRMMFDGSGFGDGEREKLRDALLAYCERDTDAMVALTDRLTELSR